MYFRADTDAYAAVLLSQVLRNRFDTIVPGSPSPDSRTDLADRNIQFVVNDCNVFRIDFVEVHNGLYGLPAEIHECGRLDSNNLGIAELCLCEAAFEIFLLY